MAYVDDVEIVASTLLRSKNTFNNFVSAASEMLLALNEDKTKVMISRLGRSTKNIGKRYNIKTTVLR